MITNYKQEDGRKCVAVVLSDCADYAELLEVKDAIILGIKAILMGDYQCCYNEMWTLSHLLEEMELTEEQAKTLKI